MMIFQLYLLTLKARVSSFYVCYCAWHLVENLMNLSIILQLELLMRMEFSAWSCCYLMIFLILHQKVCCRLPLQFYNLLVTLLRQNYILFSFLLWNSNLVILCFFETFLLGGVYCLFNKMTYICSTGSLIFFLCCKSC